jgi:hypothetical protein
MKLKVDDLLLIMSDKKMGALIPHPAATRDIKLYQTFLIENNYPEIPKGYIDFLREANGFAWNGIEFYGTFKVKDGSFFLIDLISANEHHLYHDGFEDCLMIGRSDEDIFIYNTSNKLYEVLDRTGWDVMEEFKTFNSMFLDIVALRI